MRIRRSTRLGVMEFSLTEEELEKAFQIKQHQYDLMTAKEVADDYGYSDELTEEDYEMIADTYRAQYDPVFDNIFQMETCIEGYFKCMKNEQIEKKYSKRNELERLCRSNGRLLINYSNGKCETIGFHESSDRQCFDSIEDALKWEREYRKVKYPFPASEYQEE